MTTLNMPDELNWSVVWNELRNNLAKQPPCPDHPLYPHVKTLAQQVINDVIEIRENGIVLRSHRTYHNDFIEAKRFEIWWNHLVAFGSASLSPGNPNNPHCWRSRILGAVIATCLPEKIEVIKSNMIRLTKANRGGE